MEIYSIQRPSGLPAAVCAPLSAVPAPVHAHVVVPAAVRAPLPQVHQVQVQAELVRIPVAIDGSNGTTGFLGAWSASKRMTDGARGVPPRGRPV